jgi:YD repeat-containing protein
VITSSYGVEQYRTTTAYKGADEVDVTPPSGATPTSTFTNSLGENTSLVQDLTPTPETTTYGYDAAGNMTSMKDPSGNTWTWTYDVLGDKVASKDPDTGASTSTYDDAGELLSTTDARGQELSYVYDALGRTTAEYSGSASGSLLDSWTFDTIAKGDLTSSTSYTGSTPGTPGAAYTNTVTGYTTAGQVSGNTISIPSSAPAFAGTTYTTSFAYNDDGTLEDQFDPAEGGLPAERETPQYDNIGNLTDVAGTADYGDIVYNGIGQIAQINRGGTAANYTDPEEMEDGIGPGMGGGESEGVEAKAAYAEERAYEERESQLAEERREAEERAELDLREREDENEAHIHMRQAKRNTSDDMIEQTIEHGRPSRGRNGATVYTTQNLRVVVGRYGNIITVTRP